MLEMAGRIFRVSLLSLLLASCASHVQDPKSPNGVLIIYGEGLIPSYKEDPILSTFHYVVAERFSKALFDSFEKKGIHALVYPHRDKSVTLRDYVPLLLARKKREGLVLVMIVHKKDEEENSLYMDISYRPLTYQAEPSRVMFGDEINKKYVLFSDAFDNRNTAVSTFAKNFFIYLEQTGNLPNGH